MLKVFFFFSFGDINSVKVSLLYTEKKNKSNISFLQIRFLVITNINLEEKKDIICRVPLSGHSGLQYVLSVF